MINYEMILFIFYEDHTANIADLKMMLLGFENVIGFTRNVKLRKGYNVCKYFQMCRETFPIKYLSLLLKPKKIINKPSYMQHDSLLKE